MEELAQVYAHALFEVADEHGVIDDVREQLGQFADELDENRDLQVFLFSPYFSSQEKKEGIGKVVDGADEVTVSFEEGGDSIDAVVVSTATIALVQVTAIVAGHLVGVVAAHDRAHWLARLGEAGVPAGAPAGGLGRRTRTARRAGGADRPLPGHLPGRARRDRTAARVLSPVCSSPDRILSAIC